MWRAFLICSVAPKEAVKALPEGLFTPVRGVRDTPLSVIELGGGTPSRTRLS